MATRSRGDDEEEIWPREVGGDDEEIWPRKMGGGDDEENKGQVYEEEK